MEDKYLSSAIELCTEFFKCKPDSLFRCATGYANYVYTAKYGNRKYTLRCSPEKNAYGKTVHWLILLSDIGIPVPKLLSQGTCRDFEYLILTYIPGDDIGEVYCRLSSEQKRNIAKELVEIQGKVSALTVSPDKNWSWHGVLWETLDRAEKLITANGYFDAEKVRKIRNEAQKLDSYFATLKPTPYLDDISTKNLIIQNGRVSGVIDVDELGFGDPLTYVALTYVALLNMDHKTDYVDFILTEMNPSATEMQAFWFYCLVYCVDFMGERGTTYAGKQIPVDPHIIERLDRIYDGLITKWHEL